MKITFFKKQDYPEGTKLPKPPAPPAVPTLRVFAETFEFRFNQPLLKLLGLGESDNLVGVASDGEKQYYLFAATKLDDPFTLKKVASNSLNEVAQFRSRGLYEKFMGDVFGKTGNLMILVSLAPTEYEGKKLYPILHSSAKVIVKKEKKKGGGQ